MIQVEGRSAHAGNYHAQGANAIVQLAQTVQQLAAITDYQRQLPSMWVRSAAGAVVNRVPHQAEAQVEMRVSSQQVFQEAHQRSWLLDGSSSVSSQDGFACRVNVSDAAYLPTLAATTPAARLVCLKHWQQAAPRSSIQVFPEQRGGLSDGNLLWQHVPTLDGLGPSGANAHCSERSADGSKEQEYADLASFIPKTVINAIAIAELVSRRLSN